MAEDMIWKPIESAPKDGTKIWAFLNYGDTGEEMAVIAWTGDPRWPWRLNGDGASDRVAPHIPTHWMPLPPSPTGDQDNG